MGIAMGLIWDIIVHLGLYGINDHRITLGS